MCKARCGDGDSSSAVSFLSYQSVVVLTLALMSGKNLYYLCWRHLMMTRGTIELIYLFQALSPKIIGGVM